LSLDGIMILFRLGKGLLSTTYLFTPNGKALSGIVCPLTPSIQSILNPVKLLVKASASLVTTFWKADHKDFLETQGAVGNVFNQIRGRLFGVGVDYSDRVFPEEVRLREM